MSLTASLSVGFTGTRRDLTRPQLDVLCDLVAELRPDEVHHGDALGADATFHKVVSAQRDEFGWPTRIVVHPSDSHLWRAYCVADTTLEPKPPLDRNVDIVVASDLLIACPAQTEEVRRSGTWYTIRLARRQGTPLYIIYPDGTLRPDQEGS